MFFFWILQGLSVLELHSDSLHTAAECYDGMEAEISHPDPLQQPNLALRCLETTSGGSFVENYSAECNSSADWGYCETGNERKVCVLPVSVSKSQVGLPELDLGPSEDGACPSPIAGRDGCLTQEEAEEEATEQPAVSSPDLNLMNRGEGAECELQRQTLAVGIEPAACSQQAEDSASLEAVIQEGLEATAGRQTPEQEAEECTARRRQAEATSAELSPVSRDLQASIMGQNLSPEGSTSEEKECCQDGEHTGKELPEDYQKLCDGLCLDGGLAAPLSPPGDEPCPLIEGGDVIRGPASPVPHHLIEGLHEGEPPADINRLEQKQEIAVQDYAVEQEWGLAPPAPAGGCGEPDSAEELDGENAAEVPGRSPDVQTLGRSREGTYAHSPEEGSARADSGMTCGLSGEDDCSAQAVGSSTTEVLHPTQDCVRTEERDHPEPRVAAAEERVEEQTDSRADESWLHVDAGFQNCTQTKGTGEEAHPGVPTEETGLAPAPQATEMSESTAAGSPSSECNAETGHVESEVADACSLTSEVVSAGEEPVQPTDVSDDLHPEPADATQDRSEITPDPRPPDERFTLAEDVPQPSDGTDLALEPASTTNLTSRPQSEGSQPPDSPETPGTLEGAPQSAVHGEQTVIVVCPTSGFL